MKTCSCGKVFCEIPAGAKFNPSKDNLQGWYWNCECGSTLFYQVKS